MFVVPVVPAGTQTDGFPLVTVTVPLLVAISCGGMVIVTVAVTVALPCPRLIVDDARLDGHVGV